MGSLINVPSGLDIVRLVRIEFFRAFEDEYESNPAYSDYENFVYEATPQGDLVTTIFSTPMQGMREWLDERPMSQVDWKYFQSAVRKFADGIEIDLDDVKPDAGNPANLALYREAVERMAAATALLWPSLVADAIHAGVTQTWLPDGQPIWSSHPLNPDVPAQGSLRNYYSKTTQGGGAAMPLTYGNLLNVLRGGFNFALPNGKPWPVMYTDLVVAPNLFPIAKRLTGFENIPLWK